MTDIHVIDGRLYATTGMVGLVARKDELALLEASGSDVALVLSGATVAGETAVFTLSADARLRVDSRPATDEVNLFAGDAWAGGPSVWGGGCW